MTLLISCPEFDKRTSLGVKGTFPKVMYSANFISETISKDICAQLAREVVSLVPQVVDYSCTICFSLCWLPIRLDCTHLFCIRCMIKMQNQNKRYCPLCRADVVQSANETHIDDNLVRYLERWFPKETREKQAHNELERRRELFGDIYVGRDPPAACIVM
jgi:E3 ubiquitin-protein ligase BAH